MSADVTIHVPVLAREVLAALNPQPGDVVADGTLGGGGHTRLLAERVGPSGCVVAVDRDPAAITRAEHALAGLPVKVAQSNFCELPEVLDEAGIGNVQGMLLDLGLSSDQLADRERGFSFDSDGPLDMRFDPERGEPAWRLLARLRVESLADLIYRVRGGAVQSARGPRDCRAAWAGPDPHVPAVGRVSSFLRAESRRTIESTRPLVRFRHCESRSIMS